MFGYMKVFNFISEAQLNPEGIRFLENFDTGRYEESVSFIGSRQYKKPLPRTGHWFY